MNCVCMPIVIGLCGRSGAGKSYVSKLFASEGIPSVDTDAVYREMTSSPSDGKLSDCMKELVAEFGDGILSEDMSLNRRALADAVFSDNGKAMLSKLNEITHRHILSETDKRLAVFCEEGYTAAIVDAPLLFESGYDKKCDYIMVATAPEDVLVERIISRDGVEREHAEKRLKAQLSESEIVSRADFVINTNVDRDVLLLRVREIIGEITSRMKG